MSAELISTPRAGMMVVIATIVPVNMGIRHRCEPTSTYGALVLANAKAVDRNAFFRQRLSYARVVTNAAPVILCLLFVVIR